MTSQQPQTQPQSRSTAPSGQVKPRRTGLIVRLIIAGVTALILALMLSTAYATQFDPPARGEAAEVAPPHELAPYQDYSTTRDGADAEASDVWGQFNLAMQEGDREAFLSHTTGQAREHLARWWDGTKEIGWETGYIDPIDEVAQSMEVMLGVDFTFSASPVRGTGDEEAGLTLLHGFRYDITTEGSDEGLVIASITPQDPMPWDEGPIYAVHHDHVVHYGLADERELVDATAAEAERTAQIAIDTVLETLGGQVPQYGFVSGITDSPERMDRWWGAGQQHDEFHVAGFMRSTERPSRQASHIDPVTATGRGSSGGTVILGPGSKDQLTETFVHEFAHVLHYTAVPETFVLRNTAGVEGFATYLEFVSGVAEEPLTRPEVREAIAADGIEAINTENLRSGDAWIAYQAAGSYYQFVAEQGGDPWELAIEAKANASRMDHAAQKQPGAFSVEDWQAWAASY